MKIVFFEYTRYIVVLLCLAFIGTLPVKSQFVLPKKNKKETADTLALKERFAFRTNGVEWFAMMPNFAVEFDLGATNYNHWTVGLSGRYNWDTKPKLKSYDVYNLAEGKLEVRNYWHTRTRSAAYGNVLNYLMSRERKNSHYWRTYYLGGYAAAGKFAMKFSKNGYQGMEANAGISFGAILPMYTYKQSFLDLELGASVGAIYYDAEKFRLDKDYNCYVKTGEEKGILPYPMLTDLRIAMVYRYGHSSKNKYKFNQTKHLAQQEARVIYQKHMQEKRDSINAEKARVLKAKLAAKAEKAAADSVAKVKAKADKEAKAKEVADAKAAKAKETADAKAKAKADKDAQLNAAKADKANKAKAAADAKAAKSKETSDAKAKAKADKDAQLIAAKAAKASKAKEAADAKAKAKADKATKTTETPKADVKSESKSKEEKSVKTKKAKLTQAQKDSIALMKEADKLAKAEEAAKAKAKAKADKEAAKVSKLKSGDTKVDQSAYAEKIAEAAKKDKSEAEKAAKAAKAKAEQEAYENKEILKEQALEEEAAAKAAEKNKEKQDNSNNN